MTKIVSIIYFSGSGHTRLLAESVNKGAGSIEGIHTNLIEIKGEDIVAGRYVNEEVIGLLDKSDAIVFGAPTYMSGPAAQFKAFADATATAWFEKRWLDKVGAGFTVSGAPSGDKLITLQYFQAFAMTHGMLWVSVGELPGQPNGVNRLGSWIGVIAQDQNEQDKTGVHQDDIYSAHILGIRVSNTVMKLK